MFGLANKRIVVGISGGIAAYKSADLVRRLREHGAEVRVVMTRGACAFITPLTLQALSGERVHTDLMDAQAEAAMGHIELARWADLILVAPATANFMARLGQGLADDLLATLCLATAAPVMVAPAMNQQMWANAATQDNVRLLLTRGVLVAGPGVGDQACGESGAGRMLESMALLEAAAGQFLTGSLEGSRILVSAGPTREAIDPVRFIGNRSSGRMGFAVAEAAAEAGAAVTLVAGPVSLQTPDHVNRIDVVTAEQMSEAVFEHAPQADIFVAVAAVADYRPASPSPTKIKRASGPLTLTLEPVPDILRGVAKLAQRPFLVGFAAETDALERNAKHKLDNKAIDMIAANPVGGDKSGFEGPDNELTVLWPGGRQVLPRTHKTALARQLIELVAVHYHEKHPTQDS